ncbi:MAG: single-stranded DNA-binding protein [Paludibacteraceae bacterium]|nr:single-stranded DNA-binding protein [Paludibacteraceae bacterium]
MATINKVILIGNVGKDPQVRYLDRGVAVTSFPLATTERGYTTQSGVQVPDRTEWHNIVMWRNLAEWADKYVRKGQQLYIEGKLQTRKSEKDGVMRYNTEIIVETVKILSRPPEKRDDAKPADDTEIQTAAEENADSAANDPLDILGIM